MVNITVIQDVVLHHLFTIPYYGFSKFCVLAAVGPPSRDAVGCSYEHGVNNCGTTDGQLTVGRLPLAGHCKQSGPSQCMVGGFTICILMFCYLKVFPITSTLLGFTRVYSCHN